MKRMRQLEFLVFKLGGVAGAIRRLVYRWNGVFTSSLIREALARKYPLLEPAPSWLSQCSPFVWGQTMQPALVTVDNPFE
jgi:hypothetical protein